MYSGEAPLSTELKLLMVAIFSCHIIECYGQIELAGTTTAAETLALL